MKLIIDIPEWKYKSICEGVEASKRCGVVGIDPDIHEAIYNGKPYEERPKGKWREICDIKSWQFTNEHYECDKCHYKGNKSNFCPNCGADMRKGGAE